MCSVVAKSFVLVALCSAAVPAFANAPVVGTAGIRSNSSVLNVGDSRIAEQNYWIASSQYYASTPGRSLASASEPRRVLISGYHPIKGFEAEIVAEAANRAAHTARP